MAFNLGRAAWTMAFQKTPILLTRGLADQVGGIIPIVVLTEAANITNSKGLPTGLLPLPKNLKSLDDFFANFDPMPGSTLINNTIATYPFANQAVAGNSVIANGQTVSMKMTCPARTGVGMPVKLATMTALKITLDQHIYLGGTFSVVTSSYIYTDCLLTTMRDITGGQSEQKQYEYQMDFFQPLVSLQSANLAFNNLIKKLTNGTPLSSQASGVAGSDNWIAAGLPRPSPGALTQIFPAGSISNLPGN